MSDGSMDHLDIEPEAPPASVVPIGVRGLARMTPLAQHVDQAPAGLAQALADFPLEVLLTFLPDVRLKNALVAEATLALEIDVAADGGLEEADRALGSLREHVSGLAEMFKEPVSLANQLHKRLTGLRADFIAAGDAAIATLGQRVYAEKKRRDDLVAQQRREAQALADARAREAAAAAAREASARQAPAPVVAALEHRAQTAQAPPVAVAAASPKLANSSIKDQFKARFVGTAADQEPNPERMNLLSPAQKASALLLVTAIAEGKVDLEAIKAFDWGLLNKLADRQRSTFAVPGLEVFDAGGVRGKAKR